MAEMTVIDFTTRTARANTTSQTAAQEITDQQRAIAYAEGCIDRIWIEAKKMRAILGVTTTVRLLTRITMLVAKGRL